MENITGKVLITTDWHIGLKQNSKSRLDIVVAAIKNMLDFVVKNKITTIIFCGDLFHERVAVNVNSLNVAINCVQSLAKYAKIYMIIGNHDSHLKNSIDINSLNIFKDTPNVILIDKPTQVSINGNISLLVPWLGDISTQNECTYDMVFGHFDVSAKYLIKSYIEENKNKTSATIHLKELDDTVKSNSSIGDLVGNFVDIVKNNGVIFSGHIHQHKEFLSKGRKFILIGDPYQQNLGEKNYSCGFYMLDEKNNYSFHEIQDLPKHIELLMSTIVKNIDDFDFSIVKNNIIHKIYDIDVDAKTDSIISQKINDLLPYEELLPDYEVKIFDSIDETTIQNETIDLIKKSKLEYIRKYIDNIDKKVLSEQNLDSDKLYSILEQYYNQVALEK